MTPEQQAAYVIAQAACAMVEAMGMHAENQHCLTRSVPYTPYGEEAFKKLIEQYGIHHNAVLSEFQR